MKKENELDIAAGGLNACFQLLINHFENDGLDQVICIKEAYILLSAGLAASFSQRLRYAEDE